ncbi:hypothetical protein ACJMK2_012039 [Sinanodonta woodiana]|uniref:Uncharacterized protein n=1 Tax=Sinanodonta woodiana TaxID=1069815 RepID=A0ABD3V994_SINWO
MEKEGFRRVDQGSKVITLRKGQRIRVDLTGRIQKLQTQKKYGLFVVFQPNLDTVCMEFGFEIKNELGTSHHGQITYTSDNYDKVLIDTVHFDPSKPSSARSMQCPPLFRERSAFQDKTDRLLNMPGVSAPTMDIESRERQAISRQGSNFSLFENANSSPKDSVKLHDAEDFHVNQRNPRSKRANGVQKKSPITPRRQSIHSINPQGRGKKTRPQTAKYADRKNLQIQRSKTDVSPKTKVSSPSENVEMKKNPPLKTEDDVNIRTKLRDL